jgi:hypothetical protein
MEHQVSFTEKQRWRSRSVWERRICAEVVTEKRLLVSLEADDRAEGRWDTNVLDQHPTCVGQLSH